MKKIIFTSCAALLVLLSQAQQKEGKITYERTAQIQMRIAEGNVETERMIPKTRVDNFELSFANNQSLWKQAEKENDDNDNFTSGGMHVQMIVAGSDDVLYNNFDTRKKVELRVMFDKKFVIEDSIRPLKWKMSEETKTILNHLCRKATAVNYGKRTMMSADNGKMERKEIDDTSTVTAWFTTDIPVSAGPAEYQGQLPGLILALDVNNGRQVFKALNIAEKADIASIKEPSGKKRYTPEEYKKERDKMMEDMQKNMQGGGNRQIRIN